MKKFFMIFAAAMICFAGCKKDPSKTDGSDDPSTNPTEEGYVEKTWTLNFEWDETAGYGMEVATLPGEEIADFFGLSQAEFYAGMGTYTGSSGDMTTAQENNTILFGVAQKNDTDNLKWIPATTNNFGHWYDADGAVTTWGSETNLAMFYIESNCEWGVENPDAETLAAQWSFTVGAYPGHIEGDKTYKATVVYFYTDDDDKEYYAYVEIVVKINAVAEADFTVAGTQELSYTLDYDGGYLHTPFQDDIDAAAIKSAIGIEMADAVVYGVNADGSFGKYPGANFWFDKEGNVSSWGDGCGIDLGSNEYPEDAPVWCICNFPDPTLSGTTVKAAIAFCNPDNSKAYVVKVTVTFPAIEEIVPEDVEKMHDQDIDVEMTVEYDWNEAKFVEEITDAFQIGPEDFEKADMAGQVEVVCYVDGEEVAPTGGGFVGNWFDVNGAVCNFGDVDESENPIRSYYVEFYADYSIGVGFYESDWAGVKGKTIENYKQAITFTAAGKSATVTISYKLTFTYDADAD